MKTTLAAALLAASLQLPATADTSRCYRVGASVLCSSGNSQGFNGRGYQVGNSYQWQGYQNGQQINCRSYQVGYSVQTSCN